MLSIAKQERTATVLEEFRNLIGVKRCVQGNGRASSRNNSKVGGDPSGMVIGQNRDPRALLKSAVCQPPANAFRHESQFSVGVALHPIAPLNFERNVVGPALSAFAE